MGEDRKSQRVERINILKGVVDVLQKNFASDGVEDEIKFLSIVCGNMKGLVES